MRRLARLRNAKQFVISRLFRVFGSLQMNVGLVDRETIYIEGGLGSQILSIMNFWDQAEIAESNGRQPKCDLSYFDSDELRMLENGLRVWRWRLDRYGIKKSSLNQYAVSSSKLPLRVRPKAGGTNRSNRDFDWNSQRVKYSSRFPINFADVDKFLDSEFSLVFGSRFAAIHIRRGDYLSVASHLVEEPTYLEFLKRIESILPSDIIFFSDSPLPEGFKVSATNILSEKRTYFHDHNETDECLIHDIMRLSSILVTGNSTFSFSAGLLAQESCLVFTPMRFYGGKSGDAESKYFRDSGDFFLRR